MTSLPKLRILIGALALFLATSVHAAHYKVFLLGGQSNMQGNNALLSQLPANLQPPQDDVLLYSGTNAAAYFGSLQVGAGNNFGPEISFGRAVADGRPHDRFCLIKFAQGATNLHSNWDPTSGSVYTEFKRTVTYGLDALTKAGHSYEIVGMCWTQGENDVQDFRTTAQYEADLNEFIADIRTQYGAGVKFFISRLSDNQTWRPASQIAEVRTAQDNVAAADPISYVIDTDGFDMRADNLHFEETGYVDIGEAFAASYLSATNDATAPTLDTLNPAHTDSGVEPTANLSITFDEDVKFGTGAIRLMQSGGTPVESFDVANPPTSLTLSGATLTINPTALLSPTTGYYLEIDATAIDDFSGNRFVGISGDGTWSFTTSAADTTAPGIASLSPAHSATEVLFNTNLQLTFSENIAFGSGEIRLHQAGGALVESFDVANPPVGLTLSGTTLTINPTVDLAAATGYYVEIDATAIDDHAGESFPGISGDGTWSFTTAPALISGSKITATASVHSGSTTAMPFMTIDGSGLSGGVHGTATATKWNTPTKDVTYQWIQWDLGASYTLDSIHVWNYKDAWVSSMKSVDIYYSNAPIPGDPEGAGAGNWTKLGGASVQLPEAPDSPNTGFDLETAISTTLPDTEVRFIRFELNSNWQEQTSYRTGLAEIQFTAKPGGPDLTAPDVSILSPSHTATGVALDSNLSVTFNENVAFGTGAIRLRRQSDNAVIESFDVASPPVGLTLSGSMVTMNPTADLAPSTTYYVEIDDTAIDDLVGNSFPGFSGDGTWQFTSVSADATPPSIHSLNPTHNATGMGDSSNLVITFSENVAFGSGAIRLRRQSDNAVIESFDVASPPPNLTLSGSSVTLNPTADLAPATTYYIEIDATAIDDLASNNFAGFTGDGTWRFTTFVPDTTLPTISTLNPDNGATGVAVSANLTITFSENVAFGSGAIRLLQSGGALIESFNVSSPPSGLTLTGATVTLNPTSNLSLATTYYVEIDATAIDDLAGNSFDGFTGNGTWSFTTTATESAGSVDSSGFYDVTNNAVITTGLLDWGYVSRQANNNQSGGFGSISEVNATGQDFGTLTLGGYGNLTTVSGSSSIGTVTFTEGAPSDVLSAAFTAPSANGWYSFDGNAAHGDMRGMDGNEQDVWTLSFNDLGIGQFEITVYLGVSEAQNTKVFDMDYSLVDGNTVSGTSTSATGSSYTLITSPESFRLFAYKIVVSTTTSGADLSLKFGGVSGPNGGEVLLSGYTVAALAPPSNTYADWIDGYTGLNGLTAFGDDADGDGNANGLENYFGTHPGEFSQGVVSGTVTGNTFTFTHPLNDTPATNLTATYRWSKDLSGFHGDGGEFEGTTVSFSQSPPVDGIVTVTATVAGNGLDKLFVDIAVTEN